MAAGPVLAFARPIHQTANPPLSAVEGYFVMFSLLVLLAGATATPDADLARHAMVLTAHAEGAQIYQCKPGEDGVLRWSFREPIASLMVDGKSIGHHYGGPHWALADGSFVRGTVVTTAPGATAADVPLLELALSENSGQGALATATLVYRLHTRGGVLAGACPTAGALQPVAYSADYVFAK